MTHLRPGRTTGTHGKERHKYTVFDQDLNHRNLHFSTGDVVWLWWPGDMKVQKRAVIGLVRCDVDSAHTGAVLWRIGGDRAQTQAAADTPIMVLNVSHLVLSVLLCTVFLCTGGQFHNTV